MAVVPPTLSKFFADTSSIKELEELMDLGLFSGITTNPLIVAKEAGKAEPFEYYKHIAKTFPNLPISIQLLDESIENLLDQARMFSEISPDIVIKVPMFSDGRGLILLPKLISEGIRTNVTALMNAEQVLSVMRAAQQAGGEPNYVSLFFNRIIDGKGNPTQEISKTAALLNKLQSNTEIIVGSIRKASDIYEAVMAGADIVTIPPDRVREMIAHPQSERFINESQAKWEEYLRGSHIKSSLNGQRAASRTPSIGH